MLLANEIRNDPKKKTWPNTRDVDGKKNMVANFAAREHDLPEDFIAAQNVRR